MEFLVVPRIVALVVMMPLLTIYADAMGILGGYVVGTGLLDISPRAYMQQTFSALSMSYFIPGVIKGTVYGRRGQRGRRDHRGLRPGTGDLLGVRGLI
jgi:phospholipid/cholesterol/gamma-HCH transport system permease protein